jgi:hypothetical protein
MTTKTGAVASTAGKCRVAALRLRRQHAEEAAEGDDP